MREVTIGAETKAWTRVQVHGVAGFRLPDGQVLVPARGNEVPTVLVHSRFPGLPTLRLVEATASETVTRSRRAQVRSDRQARARARARG